MSMPPSDSWICSARYPDGDERVGDLQKDGWAAAELADERRVADPTDDTLGRGVAIPARHPLPVRPGALELRPTQRP
jgi:hypothetical protein